MTEEQIRQQEAEDAEGHVLNRKSGEEGTKGLYDRQDAEQDTEGHAFMREDEGEDTEGHAFMREDESEDVEGHTLN